MDRIKLLKGTLTCINMVLVVVLQMREAAEEDRILNAKKLPATKKIGMLELAMSQINKHNLIEGFLEANVLSALTDWLAPMGDRSLPAATIREAVIKWLLQVGYELLIS